MQKCLSDYVTSKYLPQYKKINDAYIDKITNTNVDDDITNLLKTKYKKKSLIIINCNMIYTHSDFIKVFKENLNFPSYCGDSWDAVNDLIYDVIFPLKLQFVGWNMLKKRLYKDTEILKKILDKVDKSRCIIIFS